MRGAVGGIIDAFLGDLLGWALLLALGGLVVAGAAAALDPDARRGPGGAAAPAAAERPRTHRGARAARGRARSPPGSCFALDAELAADSSSALLVGACLVYFGAGELLLLLQPPRHRAGARAAPAQARARRAPASSRAVVAVAAVAVSPYRRPRRPRDRASASPPAGCNGSAPLCDLRLNEAVFAGTHNSFSAADSPGWFIANQRHTIQRQLEDGIRLFLIDPHWGVEDATARVSTDFEAEGRDRNRVAKALPPATLAAAERLAGRRRAWRGRGGASASSGSATRSASSARRGWSTRSTTIRDFLDRNPGEVVILFIEPYVSPADIEEAFQQAGLDDHVGDARPRRAAADPRRARARRPPA